MVNILYFGTNRQLLDIITHIPGRQVTAFETEIETINLIRSCAERKEHVVVMMDKTNGKSDSAIIAKIKATVRDAYIILISGEMTSEERKEYLKSGINDTMGNDVSMLVIDKKLQFIIDREDLLFEDNQEHKTEVESYRIPMWKRTFDIIFSSIAIILLSPIFLLTALAIRMESKGPILFKSKRVGTNYRIFDFLKFRSMFVDADKKLFELSKEHNQYTLADETLEEDDILIGDDDDEQEKGFGMDTMLIGDDYIVPEEDFNRQKKEENENAFVKIENDPRVTKVGRFIRKYSIDELPQLFNILKGDMSIVGNRPLPLYEAEKLTSDDSIDRFMAPAGLTGLWQVEKRGNSGAMSAEERKQLDIYYGQHYNFWMDAKIILKTVTAFIQKDNI
ncbi:MAG: sugar transferase [Prevotella sp.]|nr:sugar transferase [Prevotellaceae bacterium]MDY4891023.1 sugar transferase [Prevotella sp.]MDD7097516.1 sugar transferase [Prevotellaceae bacterium]MDY5126267.1 sugar transferase [Prevotella sp.]MDY5249997.1 sugar transferase [Prevotella sp.]